MKLYFRRYGIGQPVIILHGLFGSSVNWNTAGKILSEHYSVYLVDQRNHGRSPHSDDFNYQLMSDDLNEFFDDHSLDNAIVIGHSMGGKSAMDFTLRHPEKVSNLVVVDISPKNYYVYHQEILDALISVDLHMVNSREEVDEQLSFTIRDNALRQFFLQNLYRKEKNRFCWRFNLEIINKEINAVGEAVMWEGKTFDKPTLFIRGSKSDYILDEDLSLINRMFTQAEIKTIPGAGHWVHADQPDAFLECVINYLRS